MRLTDLLVADGVLEAALEEEVLRLVRTHGGSLDTNLLETGLVDERQVTAGLERIHGLENRVDPLADPQPEALRLLRPEQAERYRIVPMRLQLRALDVLSADPTNLRALDEVSFITGCRLITSVACECRVGYLLHRAYQLPLSDRLKALLDGERVREGEIAAARARRRETSTKPMPLDDTAPLQLGAVQAASPPPAGSPASEVLRSYEELAGQLAGCQDPDQIPVIALPYLQVLLTRVVMFRVTPEALRGWDARGPRLRREAVELIRVSLRKPSVFQWVIETGRSYEGAMPQEDVEEDLLIRLAGQAWPEHALIIPVRAHDRVAAILYGEASGADALQRAREPAAVIADLAGETLGRLKASPA